jgi:hypothetical protein
MSSCLASALSYTAACFGSPVGILGTLCLLVLGLFRAAENVATTHTCITLLLLWSRDRSEAKNKNKSTHR